MMLTMMYRASFGTEAESPGKHIYAISLDGLCLTVLLKACKSSIPGYNYPLFHSYCKHIHKLENLVECMVVCYTFFSRESHWTNLDDDMIAFISSRAIIFDLRRAKSLTIAI